MPKLTPETSVSTLINVLFKPPEEVATSTQISYRDRVHETQIDRLIEGSGFSNVVGFIMAVTWVGLLWDKLPHVVLGVWLGAHWKRAVPLTLLCPSLSQILLNIWF